MRRTVFITLVLLLPHLTTPHLSAQVVRGQLVDENTGTPISGGFVVLIDQSENEVGRTPTDDNGRFSIRAPGPGEYRLRSAVIGIRSVTSTPFQLSAGQTLDHRFQVQAVLIVLPTIVVEEERTCRERGEVGVQAAILWEESQKALNAVSWNERQGALRYRWVRYIRELHPRTLRIEKDSTWSRTRLARGSPFKAVPLEKLAAGGFIQREGRDYYFYGPDANTLLADEFAAGHCFSLESGERRGDEYKGLIGLTFQPTRGRDVYEIEGVLWIDLQTAELRNLEYRYIDLPWNVENARLGGRLEFERLSVGPWIVRRWWIRTPIVGIGVSSGGIDRGRSIAQLIGIQEVGGWIDEIETRAGKPIMRGRGASLFGVVIDSTRGEPLRAARVVLQNTKRETITDRNGRFRFTDMPEGVVDVTFHHPRLDTIPFVPRPRTVTLSQDRAVTVEFIIPPLERLSRVLCPDSDPDSPTGIVAGTVRSDETGDPLADVRVTVTGSRRVLMSDGSFEEQSVEGEGVTNETGFYQVCNVPTSMSVTIKAAGEAWIEQEVALRLNAGDIARQDFTLTRRAGGPPAAVPASMPTDNP